MSAKKLNVSDFTSTEVPTYGMPCAPNKKLVIVCDEEAHKTGGHDRLEFVENMDEVKARAFKKATKFLSWLQKRDLQRPCYIISTWREAKPIIQAFEQQPGIHLYTWIVLHMIIMCESPKQLNHVENWIKTKHKLPFTIQVAENEEALNLLKSKIEKDVKQYGDASPPLSRLAAKMARIPQPIKITPEPRFVSLLPRLPGDFGRGRGSDSFETTASSMTRSSISTVSSSSWIIPGDDPALDC